MLPGNANRENFQPSETSISHELTTGGAP